MSADPKQLAEENAKLRAQVATLQLRKPRQNGTAQMMIRSALECLDLIEAVDGDEDGDEAERAERIGMIRRVLQAEHDAYAIS